MALLIGAITFNVATSLTNRLPAVGVALPGSEEGEDLIDRGTITLLSDYGWTVGPPRPDDFWDRLLSAAREEGVTTARITVREPAFWGPTRSASRSSRASTGSRRRAMTTTRPSPSW